MWTLTSKKNGEKFYLLPGKERYVVGRSNADLVIKEDNSISRNHAWLYPSENYVAVVDVGSKYGTFYNHNIENKVHMAKNERIELKIGERIQFGQLGNEWVLSKLNICTLVSSLSPGQRADLQKDMEALKGRIVDSWDESCTHLTMSEITVTIKVLYALVVNIPIVTLDYWKVYLKELQAGNPPPKAQNFLPKLGESFLNQENVSFSSNDARKSVFSEKIFIFMSKRHFDLYRPIITKAGGECRDLNTGVPKSLLVKKNVIVIQHSSSSLSQNSQTIDSVSEYIKGHGRRVIPDCEIGLAIIHHSTQKYCNPEYDISADLVPNTPLSYIGKNIIAPRTQVGNVIAPRSQLDKVIATRTQIEEESDDLAIMSVEIPESAPVNEQKQAESMVDLFGDDVVESLKQQKVSNASESAGPLKRKRQNSVEPPEKKIHISEEKEPQSTEYRSLHPQSQDEKSVAIPETDPQRKSFKRVEQEFSQIDLSGFIDKGTILRMRKNIQPENSLMEEEEGRNKRQRFIFSSDENSDDDLMVSWNVPKKAKMESAREMLKCAAGANREKSVTTIIRETSCKSQEKPIIQKAKQNPAPNKTQKSTITEQPKRPIIFPSKLNSTGWLSVTNIKKEDNPKETDQKENHDKTKSDWIDSIKEAFEVRVRPMNLTTRSLDESTSQLNKSEKNFKAFVKKRNYKPQSIIIRTDPYVIMSV